MRCLKIARLNTLLNGLSDDSEIYLSNKQRLVRRINLYQTSNHERADERPEPAIVELFRHNLWANLRLLDACAELAPEQLSASGIGIRGRVYGTLAHIVRAEAWYVSLLTGQPLATPISLDEPPGMAELYEHAVRSGEALIAIAKRMNPTEHVRWQEPGEDVSLKVSQLLAQAINHATEHRTHVTTVLSQQAIKHPSLSGWAYALEQSGTAAPQAFYVYDE